MKSILRLLFLIFVFSSQQAAADPCPDKVAANCLECNSAGSCIRCEKGYFVYPSKQQWCQLCWSGTYCPNGYNWVGCPAGMHNLPKSGAKTLDEVCTSCPEGQYNPTTHQARCFDCPAGTQSDPGRKFCVRDDCQYDTYTNADGNRQACPDNALCNGTGEWSCKTGYYKEAGRCVQNEALCKSPMKNCYDANVTL